MGPPPLLFVGNTVLDLVGKTPEKLPPFGGLAAGRGPAHISLGGNGAIAAAAAAALGARSALASTIGDDSWGAWLRTSLERVGVETSQLETVKGGPTATTISLVRPDGERALLTHNGVSESHALEAVDLSGLEEGSWVLLAGLFLVPQYRDEALGATARGARARGARVAMDLSWDHTGEWDLDRLPVGEADVLLGNELELEAATCTTDLEVALDRMLERGPGVVVAKLGERGARIAWPDGRRSDVAAPRVTPVNSTGTGDVFNGALLVSLSGGAELEEAVRFACAAGALRVAGGCRTFPSLEDVKGMTSRERGR